MVDQQIILMVDGSSPLLDLGPHRTCYNPIAVLNPLLNYNVKLSETAKAISDI